MKEISIYELKFLEKIVIKRYLNKCLKLKEKKRVRDMHTVKSDIICGLSVDKV